MLNIQNRIERNCCCCPFKKKTKRKGKNAKQEHILFFIREFSLALLGNDAELEANSASSAMIFFVHFAELLIKYICARFFFPEPPIVCQCSRESQRIWLLEDSTDSTLYFLSRCQVPSSLVWNTRVLITSQLERKKKKERAIHWKSTATNRIERRRRRIRRNPRAKK